MAGKLQPGSNPLDFVKRNLASIQKPALDPQAALVAEEAKRAAPPVQQPIPDVPIESPLQTPKPDEVTKPEQKPAAAAAPEGESETSEEEPLADSAQANFSQMRKSLRETKTELSHARQELDTAKEELERYKTGEVVPEALAEKEAEIARLSKFEKILSLKTSKEYQDKFVAPLTTLNSKIGEIAKDYNVPPEVMQRALRTGNRAELNRFLAQHFDDVGALELKSLITQAQDLQRQATDAEKEPQTVMEQLLREGEQARQTRLENNRRELQTQVRGVWQGAFKEILEEGLAGELAYRPDDPEHNKTVVDPLVTHAATEFGKLIRDLVDNGLEKLSPEAGRALARTFILGTASGVAMETRDAASRRAMELEESVSQLNKIYRPPVGQMTPGTETVPMEKRPQSTTEAARGLINNVLAKKRA